MIRMIQQIVLIRILFSKYRKTLIPLMRF